MTRHPEAPPGHDPGGVLSSALDRRWAGHDPVAGGSPLISWSVHWAAQGPSAKQRSARQASVLEVEAHGLDASGWRRRQMSSDQTPEEGTVVAHLEVNQLVNDGLRAFLRWLS